jgi:uncharacterized protein
MRGCGSRSKTVILLKKMKDARPKFIADENVGKLARLLRLLGYDTVFFNGANDAQLVEMALAGNRIILTRDTHIPQRRPVIGGRIKAILIRDDKPEQQIRQVISALDLRDNRQPFTLCLECNQLLHRLTRKEVENRVPPYVWQTQKDYVECPSCRRVYWKGTHWEAMNRILTKIAGFKEDKNEFSAQL